MATWKVSAEQSGLSLQAFLKSKLGPNASGKQIRRAIDAGLCVLNGRVERFATRLVGTGDCLELIESFQTSQEKTLDVSEKILYIDEDLLAYDKASGVESDSPFIASSLKKLFGNIYLLHRLDKGTSGVLLFARSEKMAKEMESQFKKRTIKKSYYAIVDGVLNKSEGKIKNFLGKIHSYSGQSFWGSVSKEEGVVAETVWQVKQSSCGTSLVLCHPHTGRTHQIRVHLSEMGHPILGDHQYGRTFTSSYHPSRLMLHAAEVEFLHPRTKAEIKIVASYPSDFTEAMKTLNFNV